METLGMWPDSMTNEQIHSELINSGMIPVFYFDDKETSVNVFRTCVEAGLKVIEYTNRGESALENFKALVEANESLGAILAIGSVFNPAEAEAYRQAGAHVIVSPIVDTELGAYCQANNIPWIPGIGSTTEAYQAHLLGAEIIKVFPGAVLGPGFVKAVLAPMPWLKLMPTGGVKPTQDNLREWYDAGVVTVGMGSQLLDNEDIQNGDYDSLASKIKNTLEIINEIKK